MNIQNTAPNKRWLALVVLCMGALMIVLDVTIVNVALPSIKQSLNFSETSLSWVVNAYTIAFAGCLLLGGRLGDLFGQRRLFLAGLALFSTASLICGLSSSQEMLVVARVVQGIGGAVAGAIALSLIINLFQEPGERAKAMGVYGFVSAGGGSIGVLLGGLIVGSFDWHWIFLINIPIGILVSVATLYLIPRDSTKNESVRLDVLGAITITGSLMLAVYGIIYGSTHGYIQLHTSLLIAAAIAVFSIFLVTELRTKVPLVPLSIFKKRNVSTASVIGILWSASMFSWFFLSALYLQQILTYSPMQVGLSFLPGNLLMAFLSLGISAKIVMKFGCKKPLAFGMLLVAIGLLLFSFAPAGGSFLLHVLPPMLLMGLGAGVAFNPVLIAGMSEVSPEDSGLVSGVLNTAFMMGGSLGLAILASLASTYAGSLVAEGTSPTIAALGGYHAAFAVGALFAGAAALLAVTLLREPATTAEAQVH